MAAPAFGSAGTYLSGTATTANIAVPSSVAAGDVILVHFYIESTNTVTPPAGFTELTNSPISTTGAGAHSFHIFWKRASGADSGTYAFTYGGSSVYREGCATRYTGCIATGDPTEINNGAQRSSNGTTTPAVSGTTLGADRLLVWGATDFSSGTWTMPSGFTRRDPGTNESPVATLAQASAGSTGSLTGSCTASNFMTAFLTALIPPDPSVSFPDTITATDAWTVTETVTVADTITASDVFITDSAAVADTVTVSDSFAATDGDIVGGSDTITASDAFTVLDVPASTLLAFRSGPTYEAVVMARVPAATGAPTLLVVDDIRWSTLQWGSELSKPQSAEIRCALSTITEPVLQRLRSPAALATELWLLRDGVIVFAGPLTSGRREGEELTLTASGLLAYLERMVVFSDLVFAGVDQFAIVKALVDHWQGRSYGNFGIDTSQAGTSGVTRDATYLAKERNGILQRVQEMGQRINGFDVDVDPASRALQLWFPTRGVDRSTGEDAIVFDSRNITNPSTMFSVSAQHVATVAFGTGTASDAGGTLYSTATNAELLAQYGASAITGSWDSVSEQATLDAHVQGLLAARGDALFVPGPGVRVTPDADISAYDVGDTVRYELDDQLGIDGSFRLRSIKVSVAESGIETVTPTFV